jgi:hypothetical protein
VRDITRILICSTTGMCRPSRGFEDGLLRSLQSRVKGAEQGLRAERLVQYRHHTAGVDQTVAMKITGHRTVSVFQRYRIVSDDDVRAALERTKAASRVAPPRTVVALRPAEAAG